jgi:hypothetical protein
MTNYEKMEKIFDMSLSEKDANKLNELKKKLDECKSKHKQSSYPDLYKKCKKEINNVFDKKLPLKQKFMKEFNKNKNKSMSNRIIKSLDRKINCSKKNCSMYDLDNNYNKYIKCGKVKCKKENTELKKVFDDDAKDTKKVLDKLEKKYKSKSKSKTKTHTKSKSKSKSKSKKNNK